MNAETLARIALYSFYFSGGALGVASICAWTALLLRLRASRPALVWAASGASSQAFRGGVCPFLRCSLWAYRLGFAGLTASLVARGLAAGRPPWGSQYEFALAFAWGSLAVYGGFRRRDAGPGLGIVVPALALGLLLYASTLPSALLPTVPALQNRPLLALHVGSAIVAYGANAVACGAAALFLIQGWVHSRTRRYSSLLPHPRALDELGYRAVMVGFPMLAATLLLGSWWGSIAWGYYWNWDPKESATLATWLIYGVYLHTRTQREWGGRGSALLLLLGFAATLFTYAGNLFFSSLHSYAGV